MEGWVKLYRKLIDNDLFFDEKSFRVFIYFLLMADRSGKLRISRYRTSERLGINPNTFKSILDRLRVQHQVITTTSTSKYTTIQVRNWAKYQVSTPANSPMRHQCDTTLTRRLEDKKERFKIKPDKDHIPYRP